MQYAALTAFDLSKSTGVVIRALYYCIYYYISIIYALMCKHHFNVVICQSVDNSNYFIYYCVFNPLKSSYFVNSC